MAKIRKSELRSLSSSEYQKKLEELNKELMLLRTQASMGSQMQSPGRIRAIKKSIARIHTFAHQHKKEI